MSGLTSDDLAYLKEQASARGYDPSNVMRVMNYESSADPTRWGGKGGNYFGLIQFGPNERKQFGVDTTNPNARNQIDATFKFLQARGYKPGMGLLDLYSTINAGSPGHYKASDGNGTVASHVAKMMGQSLPTASAGGPMASASMAPKGMPISLFDMMIGLPGMESPTAPKTNALAGPIEAQPSNPVGLLNTQGNQTEVEAPKVEQDAQDFIKQMMALHQMTHEAGLKRAGLLGG